MSTNSNRGGSGISWVAIAIGFVLFWPVGVALLVAKLSEESESRNRRQDWQSAMDSVRREARSVKREFQKDISDIEQQARRHAEPGHSHYYQPQNHVPKSNTPGYTAHTYTQHSAQERMGMNTQTSTQTEVKRTVRKTTSSTAKKQPKIKDGKALMIAGIVIAALFGIGSVGIFAEELTWGLLNAIQETVVPFALTGIGVGMGLWGGFRNKKARRFRRLLNMIGDSKQIDIHALAEAVPCSYNRACDTLQDMIDEGLLGEKAYIDMSTGCLMLDGKGLGERKPRKKKAEAPTPQKQAEGDMAVLAEIRRVNDEIPDPELSRKIDRIEEITRHILDYQKKHPEKAAELHNFLDYYLPTTLKILNSYAELDRQGVEGDNISTTKERIESMMDKIVEGFETQLDKLFEGDMLDISSDIAVMEKMLSRDGLSGGMRMPRAGEEINLTLEPTVQSVPAVEPAPTAEPIPVAEPAPMPMPEPAPIPTPESTTFTTPGGISLTLNPEGEAQSAPGWEEGFYRRTKEELEDNS